MPLFLPAACRSSFAFFIASSSASFLSIRVRFHFANDSGVTGVKLVPSLWRYHEQLLGAHGAQHDRRRSYLNFQELLQADGIGLLGILHSLLLRFEHKAWGQRMAIMAVFAVWTLPEPAVPTIAVLDHGHLGGDGR